MIKYKECSCEEHYWEEIVVNKDENYQTKTVVYFHCSHCGIDFRIEDFETGKRLL
ncbi:MAG: hypothetical protein L3J09_04680 [Flavobacteriaceae bacterium]|nr:hypothetical protein [Flavobacteriaceae bacterium]